VFVEELASTIKDSRKLGQKQTHKNGRVAVAKNADALEQSPLRSQVAKD